jgi:hypothetical protein
MKLPSKLSALLIILMVGVVSDFDQSQATCRADAPRDDESNQQNVADASDDEPAVGGSPFAGMYESLRKTEAAEVTEPGLSEDSELGNYDSDGDHYSGEPDGNEKKLVQSNRIDELKARIEQVELQSASREKTMLLRKLKAMLRAAKEINGQIETVRTSREADAKRPERLADDTFVIAKIAVTQQSTTADVTFSLLVGELANANDLFDYLAGTPAGNFRDYRIISRHASLDSAETAIAQTRRDYDAYKEREAQMLAYLAARNSELARIKNSRRC